MPSPLNIAVLGAGTMAQAVHLPVLRRRWDRFRIAALVDISARRREEASDVWGVPAERRFESVGELVEAMRSKAVEVDAVVVASDGLHVDDVLAVIRRGVPVLVEPPLGFSADEIARVTDFERMTGRRLVMMAYPQQHESLVRTLAERIPRRDLRMLDYEVRMPAAQPLFGRAHVTVSAYDVPADQRSERRDALQAAVEAGTGRGATQRDRDLFVKGLLTGVAHQLAVIERVYGPLERIEAVRQWPVGVIPGSIEILGELEGEVPVRVVWHYLPFAPEYTETLTLTSARRRLVVDLPAPSYPDDRATLTLRERDQGSVQETRIEGSDASAEAMWEAFHAFVVGGGHGVPGAIEEQRRTEELRGVLERIVAREGRTLDPEPEPDAEPEPNAEPAPGAGDVAGEDLPSASPSAAWSEPSAGPVGAPAEELTPEPVREQAPRPASSPATPVRAPEPEPEEVPVAAASQPVDVPSVPESAIAPEPAAVRAARPRRDDGAAGVPATLPTPPEPRDGAEEPLPVFNSMTFPELDIDRAPTGRRAAHRADVPALDEADAWTPVMRDPEPRRDAAEGRD